ncbi:hypothetical protein ACFWTE_26925 [Nocardiopsis sp. NPDC058631]|uniref:hypothetical protein n=1 Tax=Nocardiopsis sp. NPDC058631 TaxID=3346566 RepID=UPI003666D90C
MALTVDVGVTELAATRFAISPLSETVAGLQQLAGQDRNTAHLRWLRWAKDELIHEPLDLTYTRALLVSDRPNWPEFLVPAPTGPGASIDDDVAALQRTTDRQVRSSLRRVFGDALPDAAVALADRPESGLMAIGNELRMSYERLIAPHWPRIRAVLEADVSHRARRLALGE